MSAVEPEHYKRLVPEPIDAIMGWELNFALGNVVKYVARCSGKSYRDRIDDLRKARSYLDYEIERLRKFSENK